ncbi:membrane protein, partial [Raoultella planticola]
METYNNENDQVDALKRFFAENGKALAVGVILGIGALVGWRYWSSHQQDTARESSLAYENAISALKSDKPEAIGSAEKFAADSK